MHKRCSDFPEEIDGNVVSGSFFETSGRMSGRSHKKDLATVLRLMPAKLVSADIVKMAGCNSVEMAARAATEHLNAEEIEELKEFKKTLLSKLA